jgi:lambda repressor-like predicted transcriptional regulator
VLRKVNIVTAKSVNMRHTHKLLKELVATVNANYEKAGNDIVLALKSDGYSNTITSHEGINVCCAGSIKECCIYLWGINNALNRPVPTTPLSNWLSVIKKVMKDKGINQSKLSVDSGVSKAYISEILNSKKEPKFGVVVSMFLALGVAPVVSFKSLN